MREILYRGKRVDNGKWVYGYVYQIWESVYILWGMTNGIPNMIEVIPETVGQYTGLADKNGAKVFEGDIVMLDEYVKQTFDVEDGVISYGRGGFHVKEFGLLNSLNTIASADWVLRGEVIGNIHDEPEDGE